MTTTFKIVYSGRYEQVSQSGFKTGMTTFENGSLTETVEEILPGQMAEFAQKAWDKFCRQGDRLNWYPQAKGFTFMIADVNPPLTS